MNEKTGYTFRAAWLEDMGLLTETEELMLRRMIDDYALRRIEPSPLVLRTSSEMLRRQWADIQRSLNLSYIRSQAGRKGGHSVGYGIGNQNARKTKQNEAKRSKKTKQNEANFCAEMKQNEAKTKQNEAKVKNNDAKRSKTKQNPRARAVDSNITSNNIILPLNSASACTREGECVTQEQTPYMPPNWVGFHPPTEEEVMRAANQLFITQDVAMKFLLKYTSQNWTIVNASGRTQPICNWRAKLREWQLYQQKNERTNSTTTDTNAGYAGRTRQLAERTMQLLSEAASPQGIDRSNDILFE